MENSLGLDIDDVILLQVSLETFLENKNASRLGVLGHYSNRVGVSASTTIQEAIIS